MIGNLVLWFIIYERQSVSVVNDVKVLCRVVMWYEFCLAWRIDMYLNFIHIEKSDGK